VFEGKSAAPGLTDIKTQSGPVLHEGPVELVDGARPWGSAAANHQPLQSENAGGWAGVDKSM
jgi:hypothetical protein